MGQCPFCNIVRGRMEALRIYEDRDILCVLDLHPISRGHCLIMPKQHYADIFVVPPRLLGRMMGAAQIIAQLLRRRLGATGVNILHASGRDAQQSIPHLHLHLVPRYPSDKLDTWPKTSYKEENLHDVLAAVLKSGR